VVCHIEARARVRIAGVNCKCYLKYIVEHVYKKPLSLLCVFYIQLSDFRSTITIYSTLEIATFIPYVPKPLNASNRKLSKLISKKFNSSENYLLIELSDMLVEILLAPRGVTTEKN
jgi:hypothetical protein